MAIGRISGPLLASNLRRDGVDLAFDDKLLYLDVKNGRIGIQTSSPAYELDVNGTINADNLRVTYTGPGTGSVQLGKLTVNNGVISTTVGPITIQPSGLDKINLVGDTTVTGNLHATGNITADGDITLGNNANIDNVVFNAGINSNIVPAEDVTYDLGSEANMWATAYVDTLVANALKNQSGNISITPASGLLEINGELRAKGINPIGTAPVVTNVLYVTMDGDDTNDGRAQDPSRACKTITGAVRSPYYRPGTMIRVASGRYLENNPILLQPDTAIIGDDLRTCSIEPINKTQDLFHVQSGCYIAQMQFLNGRSGVLPGDGYAPNTNRGAYATAFPPSVNGKKLDVYHSPYIQNCTNQSGPWLIDGTFFIPNQTIQVPTAVGTTSFTVNTTTILVTVSEGVIKVGDNINSGPQNPGFFNARTLLLANKAFIKDQVITFINNKVAIANPGEPYYNFVYEQSKYSRDIGLIIENIAYDATFGGNEKSVEAGLGYYDGVINLIEGQQFQVTEAINYINTLSQYIIRNNTATSISSATTQVRNTALVGGEVAANEITAGISIITSIINSGTGVAPTVFNSCGPENPLVSAEILLLSNRKFLQEEVTAYVDAQYPNFVYDRGICYRDTGLIIDAVSQDIVVGGNTKSIEAGLSYFTGSKGDSSVAEQAIVTNITLISNIIVNGTNVAPPPTSGPNLGTGFSNASVLLTKNTLFLQTEVSAYIVSLDAGTFTLTPQQEATCYKDIGLIVDALAKDTSIGGNAFSIDIASSLSGTEITSFAQALTYMTALCRNIVKNIQNTGLYQTLIPQITNLPAASLIEYNTAATNLDLITDIITVGPSAAPGPYAPISLSLSTSTTAINAFNILNANKNYLAAEVTGWVDDVFGGGFKYNPDKCFRDTGLIVDSLAFDLLYQGNTQAIFAGSQYYNQGGYTGKISSELSTTTQAINYAKTLAKQIAVNQSVTINQPYSTQTILSGVNSTAATATIEVLFNTITNILTNGTVGITNQIVSNGNLTGQAGVLNASARIQANKQFIQDQVISYADGNNTTFRYDKSKCSRDINLIVDALAQDLLFSTSSQSTFAGLQYWAQSGLTGQIPRELNTTTNAINAVRDQVASILIASNAVNTATRAIVKNEFDLIVNIIRNPSVASTVTDIIVANSLDPSIDSNRQTAYNLLVSNKTSLIQTAINSIPVGFVYDNAKCRRDVGYIIDSVAFDVLYGGNRQAVQSGVLYYNFTATNTVIPNEQIQVTAAYNYINNLADAIITGQALPIQYQTTVDRVRSDKIGTGIEAVQVTNSIGLITNIINIGPSAAPDLNPIPLTASTSTNISNAARLLAANKAFINAEVVAYIDRTFANGFVYDKVKCARDTGLIVKALAQDLLFGGISQSNFAGLQYWNQTGYTGSIASELSTTTNTINFVRNLAVQVITKDTSGTRYQTAVSQWTTGTAATIDETQIVYDEFNLIVDIITNGTVGVTDRIVSNSLVSSTNFNIRNAYALLTANKAYIQAEAIAFVEASKTTGFTYDPVKCRRDVGYMVDSVAFDLLYSGNRQAIQSGVYYFSYSNFETAVPNEQAQVTAAYNYINTLTSYVVTGRRAPSQYQTAVPQVVTANTGTTAEYTQIAANITRITNIINSGTSAASSATSISLAPSTTSTVVNAAVLLDANADFITAEVVAYIDATFTNNFNYDRDKCRRDVGYILDCVCFDLIHGGNRQSIQAGVYYYGFDTANSVLTYEITQATAAYNHIKTISKDIIRDISITPTSGNTVSQVKYGSVATVAEATYIANDVNIITDIINTGDVSYYPKTPIGLTASTDANVIAAYNQLIANREFIQNELIAYINYYFVNPFVFNKEKCERDTKLIIDSVALDILYNSNSQSTFAGLQYWNQSGYTGQINSEVAQTVAAIDHIDNVLVQPIIPASVSATVSQLFNTIKDIINQTITNSTDLIVANGLPSTNTDVNTAYNAIVANKSTFQQLTEQWVYDSYSGQGFIYDRAKCRRDVGYILDCVAFDLLHGGNRQSVQAGVYYFNFNGTTNLVDAVSGNPEIPQSTAAYNYLKYLMKEVLLNTPITRSYQVVYPQVIIPAYMGLATVIPGEENITADAITYLNTLSQYVISNTSVPVIRSSTLQTKYLSFEGGQYAGPAVARNYNIIANIIQNGPNTAPVSYAGTGLFATTGVSANDVRQSPTVIAVTTITGNTFSVVLSNPTVGYSENGTLYFGETAVFPLQDVAVEAQSLKYTGNASTWNQRKVDKLGSMGGSLVDGGVVSDRSPIQSFVYDAFTQVNQGGRGIRVTNNGYAQLVSVFTIFCSTAVQVDNGGICSITNSNSNFGDECLVAKGFGKREFSGTVFNPPYPTYQPNGQYYPNGYYPKNGVVELFIPDIADRPHIALVMEVEPPDGYTNEQGFPGFLNAIPNMPTLTTGTITITGIDTLGIAVGNAVYIRDRSNNQGYVAAGTVVVDVNYQSVTLNKGLTNGGGDINNPNFFTLYFCGNAYYTVLSSTVTDSHKTIGARVIATAEVAPEVAAVYHIRDYVRPLLSSVPASQTFVQREFNIINEIITATNFTVAQSLYPNPAINATPPSGAVAAITIINNNVEVIVADAINYINTNYPTLAYSQDKCKRDIREILLEITNDLTLGGISRAVASGLSYWQGNLIFPAGQIQPEITSLNYMRDLLTTATGYLAGLSADTINFVNTEFNNITTIITATNLLAAEAVVPNPIKKGTPPAGASSAISIINANIKNIAAKTLANVGSFIYDKTICSRDTGIIVDSIAIDLLYGSNSDSTFAGLQYWAQSGSSIPNEKIQTTDAIGYLKTLAVNSATIVGGTASGSIVSSLFDVILNILNNGTVGITDKIVANNGTTSTNVAAYTLLMNLSTGVLPDQVIAYVNRTYPGFAYNTATCYRDVGYIIDSVAFDLTHGGNKQSIKAGVYYYGFDSIVSAVPQEQPQVIGAYNFIKNTLIPNIVTGTQIAKPYQSVIAQNTSTAHATNTEATQLAVKIDIITNIINNGPSAASALTPITTPKSPSTNINNAYNILIATREFIKAEVIGFIEKTYNYNAAFFNTTKCRRDVELILKQIVYDLETGGNYYATFSGLSYWIREGTHHVVELGESVNNTALFPDGAIVNFYQRSYISASGYLFEYVGAGSNYGALPQRGVADPIQGREVIQLNNGKVFFTSTDQNGDFRIGPGLVISQATGVLSGRTFTKSLFANMTPFILAISG